MCNYGCNYVHNYDRNYVHNYDRNYGVGMYVCTDTIASSPVYTYIHDEHYIISQLMNVAA